MNIRKVAIGFALISTAYWMGVQELGRQAIDRSGTESLWLLWLVSAVPAMVYAVFCLFFCHRLARAIGMQARRDTFK